MAFLVDAYTEDEAPNTKGGVDKRTVLRSTRAGAGQGAVLPLSRNADCRPRPGPGRRAAPQLERRLRRRRRHRQALPPPGRDRHAVLRHGRLRHPRRRRGDDPRARHDGPGAGIIDSLDRGGALSALADVSTGDQVGNAYDDGIVSILDGERDRFVVLSNDYSRYVAQEWGALLG
jgi:hypothetical protein